MAAIARVESGRRDPASGETQPWPWTINAEGRGSFYPDKAAALAAVRALQAQGVRSIDIGCMQVNLRHHPNAFASLEDAFDPLANARYAARFLTELQGSRNDWMAAASAYHSQTPEFAAPYRARVASAWAVEQGLPPTPPVPSLPSPALVRVRPAAASCSRTVPTARPSWPMPIPAAAAGSRPIVPRPSRWPAAACRRRGGCSCKKGKTGDGRRSTEHHSRSWQRPRGTV